MQKKIFVTQKQNTLERPRALSNLSRVTTGNGLGSNSSINPRKGLGVPEVLPQAMTECLNLHIPQQTQIT